MNKAHRDSSAFRDLVLLAALACAAFCWVVARAHIQSVTIDEADSFSVWAAGGRGAHWISASNNHLLNSMLMRLSTSVFGVTHLSVRLPALTGAAIYLSGAVALCLSVQPTLAARLVLFVLLCLNPMTQDYLVAARGYGMASGFLLWALWLILRDGGLQTPRAAVAASCCLALSFASNFSFAWVCCAVFAAGAMQVWRSTWRTRAALVLPGLALTLLLSAPTAWQMPRTQLWFGTKSAGRTFTSVRDAFVSTPSLDIANPWVFHAAMACRTRLVPALLAGLAGTLLLLAARRSWDASVRRLVICGAILSLTAALHYLAYRAGGILLPLERTAIFLVPLAMLLFVTAAWSVIPSRPGRVWQNAYRGALVLTSLYLLLCLRLTWFAEWRWNADTRQLHDSAAWWAKVCPTETVASSWHFLSAWSFYETMSGQHVAGARNKDELRDARPAVWLLLSDFDRPLIERRGLHVVWQGESGAMVAVSPACAAGLTQRADR